MKNSTDKFLKKLTLILKKISSIQKDKIKLVAKKLSENY